MGFLGPEENTQGSPRHWEGAGEMNYHGDSRGCLHQRILHGLILSFESPQLGFVDIPVRCKDRATLPRTDLNQNDTNFFDNQTLIDTGPEPGHILDSM